MKLIKNSWEVLPIDLQLARGFVEEHHYAHGAANTAVACYGLYYQGDKDTLHGISWWMPPPLGAAKAAAEDHRRVLSLSRFCLVEGRPENAGSFLISRSIQQLDHNRWSMLLTYADIALGHNGGLYRAANWTYSGVTGKQPMYWDPTTGRMVSRKKGPKSFNKQEMIDQGYEFRGRFSKHKFVYPICRRNLGPATPRQLDLIFTEDGKIKS